MTVSGMRRLAATSLATLIFFASTPCLESQTKKKASAKRPASTARKPVRKAKKKTPATPLPVAVGVTFEERLSSLVNGTVSRSSDAGVMVVEVKSGRVIAERNPDLSLTPASNMKIFTTAAALDILKPSFDFVTTVSMRGSVEPTGTLHGDVRIVGRGDATIGSRFHDGDATAVIDQWAVELQRAGVKAIEGDLIFEYGYLDTEYIHPSWPTDQLLNWYEAPVSAFSMQEGCVLVRILPSSNRQKAIVQMEPKNTYLTVDNHCITGRGRPLVTRRPGTNELIIGGGVPPRSGASEIFITVVNPIHYFAQVTQEAFERNGIHLLGQVRLVERDPRTDWKVVTEHKTPLAIHVYVINKKSQNHYAEQLIKVLGAESAKGGSWEGGAEVVAGWLKSKVGASTDGYLQADGSGMSRFNRATPRQFIKVLRYMAKTPYMGDFLSSMPYTGDPDSKFGKRLKNAPYGRQIYAKTGYISGVVALSGYVHGKSGTLYAFTFLFNRYHTGVFNVYRLHDEMLKEIVKGG